MIDVAEKERRGLGTVWLQKVNPDARAVLACSVAGSMLGQEPTQAQGVDTVGSAL